ncbi:hypothetical protein OAV88_03440 [bacterium]|nr:hypothetical protein [bacterium]
MIQRTRVSPKVNAFSLNNRRNGASPRSRPKSPLRQTGVLRKSFIRVPPRLSSTSIERRSRLMMQSGRSSNASLSSEWK